MVTPTSCGTTPEGQICYGQTGTSVTLFTRIEEHFGDELSPDLITRIARDPTPERLAVALISAIRDGRQPRLDAGDDDILFPYIPLPRSQNAPRGMSFTFEDLKTREISEVFSGGDALKHHLLYCHKVAVDDPFVHMEMMFHPSYFGRWSIPSERIRLEEEVRRYLVSSLTLLLTLRPLIDSGVLNFIDPYDYWHTDEAASELLIAVGDCMDWSSLPGVVLNRMGPVKPRTAAIDLASTIIASDYHRTNFAMYVPYESYRPILNALVGAGVPGISADRVTGENESVVLGDLLNLAIPGLGDLTPSDIASIRRDDELFEAWRSDLRSAVVSAKTYLASRNLVDVDAAEGRHIREMLRPSALRLESAIRQIKGSSVASREVRRFGIGSVSAAMSGGIDSPLPGLGRAIDEYLRSRKKRSSIVAAYRHYVAIGDTA
jgi:hypothetical protein